MERRITGHLAGVRKHRTGRRVTKRTDELKALLNQENWPRSRIEVRPTTLPRPHALDSAAVADLGRTRPHASIAQLMTW